MTVRSCKEAISVALQQTKNVPGTCQKNVHEWYAAPSVGDVDHDGDADAVDGWESEPKAYRHPGDRNPPPGVPIAFKGGSKGYGHRAMTLAHPGRVRSTDMLDNRYSAGHTDTVTGSTTSEAIAQIERSMNVVYLGWSETISGFLIPDFVKKPTAPPPVKQTRGARVDLSLQKLRRAHAVAKNPKGFRARTIAAAIKTLLALPTHDVKTKKR